MLPKVQDLNNVVDKEIEKHGMAIANAVVNDLINAVKGGGISAETETAGIDVVITKSKELLEKAGISAIDKSKGDGIAIIMESTPIDYKEYYSTKLSGPDAASTEAVRLKAINNLKASIRNESQGLLKTMEKQFDVALNINNKEEGSLHRSEATTIVDELVELGYFAELNPITSTGCNFKLTVRLDEPKME